MPRKTAAAKSDLFAEEPTGKIGNAETGQLRAFVERIENVAGEIDALSSDRKDIYSEAKSQGFDVKAMRRAVAIRKKDRKKWEEEEAILDTYLLNLGLL